MNACERRLSFVSTSVIYFALIILLASCGTGGGRSALVCQADVCDLSANIVNGKCVKVSKADGTACVDDNPCTVDTQCLAGVCRGTSLPDNTPCDDKNKCTQDDFCQSGECVGTNPLVCEPIDSCHEAVCDALLGCVQQSLGPCDGNLLLMSLTGCAGSEYMAQVTLGGTQTFDMIVDSGSTTLGVAAASCTTCSGLSPLYTPGATAVDQKATTSAEYADGSTWNAEIYRDSMRIGSTTEAIGPDVSLRFSLITSEKNFFTQLACYADLPTSNAYQGILGLGPTTLALPNTDTYIDKVKAINGADAYAVQVCPKGGRMWVGGYDANYVAASPNFVPMAVSDYFAMTVSDVGLRGIKLGLTAAQVGTVMVDTGTIRFVLRSGVYNQLVSIITKDQGFLSQFTSNFFTDDYQMSKGKLSIDQLDALLPPLTLTVSNATGTGKVDLSFKPSESYLIGLPLSTNPQQIYFFSGIVSSGSNSGLNILGNVAMNNRVIVFDRGNKQIGFAPARFCSAAVNP